MLNLRLCSPLNKDASDRGCCSCTISSPRWIHLPLSACHALFGFNPAGKRCISHRSHCSLAGDETSPIGHTTGIAALQGGHRSHCKGCFTVELLQIQPLYCVNTNLTQVNIEGEGIDGPKWTCYPHTLPDPRAEGSIRNTPEIARRPLGGLSSPRTCSPSTSLDGKLS